LQARDYAGKLLRMVGEFFEDQWFDRTRNVRTSGDTPLVAAGIRAEEMRDSELYVPARPRHIREALREALRAMPPLDVTDFTYVDLGSGKGRSLFVAAELPFQKIIGVEFSQLLHEQARANIRRYRTGIGLRRVAEDRRITSLHQNAKDFVFPEEKLVLYLFNPFGAETMRTVLANLEASLEREPRPVMVILLWPRWGDLVGAILGMRLCSATRCYQIFAAHVPEATTARPA
jgi:SAM-dependent methyltransferase